MIINLQDFKRIKRKITKNKKFLYKFQKKKKIKNLINNYNKNDIIYNFGIDKVYNLSILHSKINWYKYYLELYFTELLQKYENIQNNKINLK